MCGICGLFGWDDHRGQTRSMAAVLRHRGPDDEGFYDDPSMPVSLGMRRLAIVDPRCGRQPYVSEDGQVVAVFNGEIFNAPRWREALQRRGHRFRTDHCDGEVIVHLYEDNGPSFVRELNGMFAFALWDRRRRWLLLGRDPFGIKPLFYRIREEGLAFASEIKALRVLSGVSQEIDRRAVSHYLSLQYIPAPYTIHPGLRKLAAGEIGLYRPDEGRWDTYKYWRPDVRTKIEPDPSRDRRRILAVFDQAVKRWSLSDVPLAVSLSGGLDSAAVAVAMERNGIDVEAYTVGFEASNHSIDESALARRLADLYGWSFHEFRLHPWDVLADLPVMLEALDEPYAGGLPSWFIYKAMAGRVKVAMTGTGGDELFGHYGKGSLAVRPFWWRWMRRRLKPSGFGTGRLEDRMRHPLTHHYPLYVIHDQKQRWLLDCPDETTEGMIESLAQGSEGADPRDRIAYVDMQLQLPEEFLMMTDRFSMHFSVEARVPFLDQDFVQKVFLLPAGVRAPLGDPKRFWRRCLIERLPIEHLQAPKRGFVLPLADWTRGVLRPMIEKLFDRDFLIRQKVFHPFVRDEVIEPYLNGRGGDVEVVWTFVMFQLWWRRFITGDLEEVWEAETDHAHLG